MRDWNELRDKARAAAYCCCGNTTTGGEYMGMTEEVCCGRPEETGDTIEASAAEILALIAENNRLRKDAARLDWLTEQGEIADPGQGDLRDLIDIAMSKGGQGNG